MQNPSFSMPATKIVKTWNESNGSLRRPNIFTLRKTKFDIEMLPAPPINWKKTIPLMNLHLSLKNLQTEKSVKINSHFDATFSPVRDCRVLEFESFDQQLLAQNRRFRRSSRIKRPIDAIEYIAEILAECSHVEREPEDNAQIA